MAVALAIWRILAYVVINFYGTMLLHHMSNFTNLKLVPLIWNVQASLNCMNLWKHLELYESMETLCVINYILKYDTSSIVFFSLKKKKKTSHIMPLMCLYILSNFLHDKNKRNTM